MLLSILMASTKTLTVCPRYSVRFPLMHLPGRSSAMATNHGNTSPVSVMAVPISSSRRVPFSLTETMHTAGELTQALAERCNSQAMTPARCVPLELSLNNCSMWPQHGTVAFSLSLWLRVGSEMELTTASVSAHSLGSESTTDLDLSPTGTLHLCSCLFMVTLQFVMLCFCLA